MLWRNPIQGKQNNKPSGVNMLKFIAFLKVSAVASLLVLGGCMAQVATPITGFAFTDVQGPLLATNSEKEPERVGRATMKTFLGLIATGDASIQTAAKNGGITEIHHVDYEAQSIFGLIADFTVVVYGN